MGVANFWRRAATGSGPSRRDRRTGGRRSRRAAPDRPRVAAEVLEDRVLPAVTLTIDYSLDNGFFASQAARDAMQAVALEIGSRLNDDLGAVAARSMTVTNPTSFNSATGSFSSTATRTFALAANELRVFVGGAAMASGMVGVGGWRTSSGIRGFDVNNDFEPYVGHIAFDADGGTRWNFNDTAGVGETNFRAVARHELLHALGLGGATSWDVRISGGFFTGAKTRTANGGVSPAVDPYGGHFAQGVDSIMAPTLSAITHPTAVDWAALDDIGWDVSAPPTPPPPPPPPPPAGAYADVLARASDGTWYVGVNGGAGGLSAPSGFGKWSEAAGWKDVATGDFDGDGRTDVVGRTSGGAWYVGLNNGSGLVNAFFGVWSEAAGWRDVTVGDFDGDGKDDVAGRTFNGEWWVGRSTGAGFATSRWTVWNEAVGWRDVRIGDFDGDGRDDLAGRTSTGNWWVGVSTAGGLPGQNYFENQYFATWNESLGWRDVLVADFDANGKDDLAARTAGGAWLVGLSLGTRFATGHWATWSEAAGWRGVTVGDFTGDAKPDIVGRTSDGAWYVAQSWGASFSTHYLGYWNEASGWRDLQIGDFTGGSKAEVLARTSAGTWYVGDNDGTKLTFRAFGQWNEGLGWRSVSSSKHFRAAAAASAVGSLAEAESEPLAATVDVSPRGSAKLPAGRMPVSLPATETPVLPPPAADRPPAPADRDNALPATTPVPRPPDTPAGLLDSLFGDAGLLDALTAA